MTPLPDVMPGRPAAGSRTADAPRRWRGARNVLAVRLDNLGDLLMTTPALAAVRETLPEARLTVLASPSGAALAGRLPGVDAFIAGEVPWMKPSAASAAAAAPLGRAEHDLVERLAACRFDAAIVFTVCTQSALPAALVCRMAGIPLRLAHSRENPYGLLSDWVPDGDLPLQGVRHEVQRQLDLVRAAGLHTRDDRLRLHHDAVDAAGAKARRAAAGGDASSPYLVVHPGATAPSRRYLPARYGQAAEAIAAASGVHVVFAGGEGDRAAVDEALAAMTPDARVRAVSLAGALSLGELAALIDGAEVTLCNNSAPAHIAAAVGAPVVVLYALTNPQHTPWRTPSRVLWRDVRCRDCLQSVCPQPRRACLDDVPVEDVVAAALDLMRSQPRRRPSRAGRPPVFSENPG